MWLKKTRIILLVLAAILCSSALLTGCVTRAKMDGTLIQNTGITDVSDATTRITTATPTTATPTTPTPTTPTPTSNPTPTPTPTSMPTSMPTPTTVSTPTLTSTPASVFIPRETLPDGQLLETGYYAVLPGEGAYYNVYDCYGKQIDSFQFIDYWDYSAPIGLFTEKELAPYYRFNQKDVKTILPQNTEDGSNYLYNNQNGFYQVDYEKDKVILYNTKGVMVKTIQSPLSSADNWVDMVVTCIGDETVVSFATSSPYSIAIYFVSSSGSIKSTCITGNLPQKPVGLVGQKYVIINQENTTDWNGDYCTLVDFSGKVIMKDVSLEITTPYILCSNVGETYVRVSDYFTKDGVTYDSTLNPVDKNTLDAEGNLIYGVEYDVSGIACTASYTNQGPNDYNQNETWERVAVGTKDNRIAIKTKTGEYVFDSHGASYYAMNNYVVLLLNNDTQMLVISLETGKVIQTIEKTNEMKTAPEYILKITSSETNFSHGYIVDKNGNIRYSFQNSDMQTEKGEYIVLYRGPYVGIADLNGDWVIKTLQKNLTRDDEATNPLNQ